MYIDNVLLIYFVDKSVIRITILSKFYFPISCNGCLVKCFTVVIKSVHDSGSTGQGQHHSWPNCPYFMPGRARHPSSSSQCQSHTIKCPLCVCSKQRHIDRPKTLFLRDLEFTWPECLLGEDDVSPTWHRVTRSPGQVTAGRCL